MLGRNLKLKKKIKFWKKRSNFFCETEILKKLKLRQKVNVLQNKNKTKKTKIVQNLNGDITQTISKFKLWQNSNCYNT